MLYREFGSLGWKVSAVGMGCWNIGGQWGEMTDEQAAEIIHTAYDAGVNLFDVAEAYGNPHGTSELRLGRALKDIRDKVYIVSKIGSWGFRQGEMIPKGTVDSIRLCGHAICGRLQTRYVDVVLCHNGSIEDPSVYIAGFNALMEEGFVKAYGISTNSFEVFKRFYDMSEGKCRVLELDYSLINRQPEEELLPFCKEHGVAVLARGPLAQGILSGKFDEKTVFTDDVRKAWSEGGAKRETFLADLAKARTAIETAATIAPELAPAEAAIRYTISHAAAPVAIPGMTSVRQAKQNAACGNKLFTQEELKKF
ncbi:MAG: aldo/keto reductase [Clostridia bacterium]|nr:aldo/keto reductase [Clostridia bacterium]